jgi:uncharacterized protein with PIN domain
MNKVDSSVWLAYFADEPNAKYFASLLKGTASLVVPTVTICSSCPLGSDQGDGFKC